MDKLERSSVIALFFAANTMSPISLLEMGLHARAGKVVVCCELGYLRRQNVVEVCHKYGIMMVPNIRALAAEVLRRLSPE